MQNETFQEISANLILVECTFVSVVIAKGAKVAIIDTAISELMPKAIIPALDSLNIKIENIEYVINTHGHWDHVQGNLSIMDESMAEIWIPAAEMEKLSSPADRLLFDGDIIDLGNSMTFELITVPGHSLGISCLYNKDKKILIASDAAQGYGGGMPLIFHSPTQYRASIEKLLTLDIETLVLGHRFLWSGPAQFIHRGKDVVKSYLQECLEASRKVSDTIYEVVANGSNLTYEYVERNTIKLLQEDASYPFDPAASQWRHGTILSELRERGITLANSAHT